ncbi:MAG: lamin tail domain-containing protein [bacterium]|nr:lamin tail domain-containing protein [bacterium]
MKKLQFRLRLAGSLLVAGWLVMAPFQGINAQEVSEPEIIISRYKITSSNGQFFELHNNSAVDIDMSGVQLAYYNNYDLTKATSSKLVSLQGILPAGGHYLVNDSALTMCFQMTVASASLGFSSTAGMVQLIRLQQQVIGGQFTSQVLDYAAWSRTAVSGVQQLPPTTSTNALLQRTWPKDLPKTSSMQNWLTVQPSVSDPCVMESTITKEIIEPTVTYTFLPSNLPPVRYVSAPATTSSQKINRNVGKMAPVINEVLPNPASPQTDANDEFVEIYNPNSSSFDLSGFKLAFGSTKPSKYTFPEGTVLKPKQFKTFNSGSTSISLTNTLAQVWLLDPNEKIVTTIEPYTDAKSGQSWARNGDKWAWTAVPSPNAENTLSPIVASGASGTSAASILGINQTAVSTPGAKVAAATPVGPAQLDDAAPLHPVILAVVGAAALGYALYEYRHDFANKLFQLKRHFRVRRSLRT